MNNNYWNEELETLSWAQVESWQAEQIYEFARKLAARSPMYNEILKDTTLPKIRSLEDLEAIPFTTKQQLKDAQSKITTDCQFGSNQGVPSEQIVQALSSSGSTGSPMYYALTGEDLNCWTDAIANTFYTAGLRSTDSIAHLVGLPGVAGGLPYADAFRAIGASLFWIGGFSTERILREIGRLKVNSVLATTSFGVYLAEQILEGNSDAKDICLKKYLSGGEPGLGQPEIRNKISQGMSLSHIREVMGLGDVMSAMWAECEEQNGMHFNAQRYVAIELIDPETGDRIPWKEGAKGEMVYTTFIREATPVLRYRSRDHIEVIDTQCSCGRTSPRIRCIGRTDDMLIYKGMNVFPTAVRELISSHFNSQLEPYIRIWKETKNQVKFKTEIPLDVEAKANIAAEQYPIVASHVENEIRQQLQIRVAVNVVAPGELPRSSYKTPLIYIRDVNTP